MSNEIVKIDDTQELSAIERLVMQGDLSKLSPEQRVTYYRKVCDSAGLNPYTRPLEYIILNGKMTLYARKDATEQLRKLNGISIVNLETTFVDDLYIVKATATTRDGRTDTSTGAVVIGTLKGEAKANAIMKAETKAKRRVTLSISGMGWTDESEIDSIPGAKAIDIDLNTGEIQNGVKPLYISENQVFTIDQLINGHDDIRGKIMSFIRKGGGQALADIKAEDFDKIMRNIKAFIDQKITTISAKPEAFDDSNAPDDAEEK